MNAHDLSDEDFTDLLHKIDVNSNEGRRAAAAQLIGIIAVYLVADKTLPAAVREWLAATLVAGLQPKKHAAIDRLELVLRKGAGGVPDRDAQVYAHVYALTKWGCTQEEAAEIVRSAFDAPAAEDASNTKKRSNRGRKAWRATGPFLADRMETEAPEATIKHLRAGRRVLVELSSPGGGRTKYICLNPQIVRANKMR